MLKLNSVDILRSLTIWNRIHEILEFWINLCDVIDKFRIALNYPKGSCEQKRNEI